MMMAKTINASINVNPLWVDLVFGFFRVRTRLKSLS